MSGPPSANATEPKAPSSGWFASSSLALSIVHPPELAAVRLELGDGLVLGRQSEPGVAVVAHSTVSRRHAAIQHKDSGLWLVDLDSRNGTSVNGAPAREPTYLLPQSIVRLGDVLAVVDQAGAGVFDAAEALAGTSPAMVRAREQLARAAPERAPVLIVGETGVGKERLAFEVHRRSGRPGAYVTLNCAELTRELIESQLFGHRRGAFTGASGSQEGLFVAADGGTLFLDEIGELSLDLQPKLLRVLEDGQVRALGSTHSRAVDVRIVAATNRNLDEWVEQGGFRRDLYARLALFEIHLPPLRERRQDLLAWLELLHRGEQPSAPPLAARFHPDVVERLLLHPWLDNLRGLKRLVVRLGSGAAAGPIGVRALLEALPELEGGRTRQSSLPAPPQRSPSAPPGQKTPTREELLAVLEANGFSVRATSKHFGRDRRQIYRWIEAYGIERDGR